MGRSSLSLQKTLAPTIQTAVAGSGGDARLASGSPARREHPQRGGRQEGAQPEGCGQETRPKDIRVQGTYF